tara:strand:+ start:7779 stop:8549 length:771 start_codon:yes stop_codon:yes gene_type:complete
MKIKKAGHIFRKKWGQNFLTDNNLLDRIARTINPKNTDSIFEIGPGEGALTERVLPDVKEIAAIEIDPMLIDHLKNRSVLEGLHILHGDVLLQEINELPISEPVRVVGNIPYNITSPILFWLIEQLDFWTDAHIMMQKEMAERLSAEVGTKAYGRLSVVVGAYLNVKYCFSISPDVFIPKPKVESAIVRFTKKEAPIVPDEKYKKFNKLVTTAFSQRRKMLRNTLKSWNIPKEIQNKIDFTRRPETLTVEEFASMV